MSEKHSYQRQGKEFVVGTGEGDSFRELHRFPTENDAIVQVKYLDEKAAEEAKAKSAKAGATGATGAVGATPPR